MNKTYELDQLIDMVDGSIQHCATCGKQVTDNEGIAIGMIFFDLWFPDHDKLFCWECLTTKK